MHEPVAYKQTREKNTIIHQKSNALGYSGGSCGLDRDLQTADLVQECENYGIHQYHHGCKKAVACLYGAFRAFIHALHAAFTSVGPKWAFVDNADGMNRAVAFTPVAQVALRRGIK